MKINVSGLKNPLRMKITETITKFKKDFEKNLTSDPDFHAACIKEEPNAMYVDEINGCRIVLTCGPVEKNTPLSSREKDVANLLGRGLGNKGIAGRLNITVDTVKDLLKAVFLKLRKTSRAAIARWVSFYLTDLDTPPR